MLLINFAKRARKLVPDLVSFKIEQIFTPCDQGYFVSRIYMWIHTETATVFGTGDSKLNAWDNLKHNVERSCLMPTDKLRQPNRFPALFHYPLQAGLGTWTICRGTKAQCKSAARKYRGFLRSLREYPLHPSLKQLEKYSVRTEVRQGIEETFSMVVHVKGKLEIPGI